MVLGLDNFRLKHLCYHITAYSDRHINEGCFICNYKLLLEACRYLYTTLCEPRGRHSPRGKVEMGVKYFVSLGVCECPQNI